MKRAIIHFIDRLETYLAHIILLLYSLCVSVMNKTYIHLKYYSVRKSHPVKNNETGGGGVLGGKACSMFAEESCVLCFVVEPEGRRALERPSRKGEDNVKIDTYKKTAGNVNCIDLNQDRSR
jgi:hypothetical protein